MSTKSITITEEAYKRLAVLKEGKESFSDVINKVTKKRDLMEFAGVLTKKEADSLERRVRKSRGSGRKELEKIREELSDT